MIKLNELKKDTYYAIYENDKLIGACESYEDYQELDNSNLKLIEKECYEFYDDGNYDDANSREIVEINVLINDKKEQYIFKNSVGFSICLLHNYFTENEIKYEFLNIIEYNYFCCGDLSPLKEYKMNSLTNNLLTILNYNNMCIISNLLNTLLYHKLELLEQLEKNEISSTHYTVDNVIKEVSIERIQGHFDICMYDVLTPQGMRNLDVLKDNKKKSKSRNELIKNITIYELLCHYDITFIYSFYKMLFEEEVIDPVEFIK